MSYVRCNRSKWILVAAFGVLAANAACRAADSARPNVLIVLADDLGWSDLGCYGADLHQTPALDAFAKQAMRFTAAYASAPVCSPTRAAIMTGKYPARLGITTWRENARSEVAESAKRKLAPPLAREDLPFEETTLAEALKQRGYATAHIGKWHLGDAGSFPEAHGYDLNIGGNHFGATSNYFFPYRGMAGKTLRYVPGLPFGKEGEYLTDRLTDEAIRTIERLDRPFFMTLWHYAVHTPMQVRPADEAVFAAKIKPGMRHRNPKYAAMLENLDANFGRVWKRLEELKLADNTIVVFTSDNGGFLGRDATRITDNTPLRSGKGSLYEGGLRVPFLIRVPGMTRGGSVCEQPIVSHDLYPTLLELCGGEVPQSDGVSFCPSLEQPDRPIQRREIYWHFPHYYPTTTPVSSVRDGDWKLLEYLEDGRVELFDVAHDLGEEHELSRSQPLKADELTRKLHVWRKSVAAMMPTPQP